MTERCPFCGQISQMIWVRAHYQCATCGQIVVPCCNGETADCRDLTISETGANTPLDSQRNGKDA